METAGVSKTALAVYWAHQVANRFPDGQLYVNLRGFDPSGQVMASAEAVRRFLDALQVPAERIPVELDAQAALYRSELAGKRMLVVLDNARDTAQVRPYLHRVGMVHWADMLQIRGQTDAAAVRLNPDRQVVWQVTGTMVDTIDGLIQLPHPQSPFAPRLVVGKIGKLWVPNK